MSDGSGKRGTRRVGGPRDENLGQDIDSVKVTSRLRPGVVDIAEELGFKQTRLTDIGPGALKPSYGRGGSPVPDKYYLGESDLKVPEKKGDGIAAPIKKIPESGITKLKWSEVV